MDTLPTLEASRRLVSHLLDGPEYDTVEISPLTAGALIRVQPVGWNRKLDTKHVFDLAKKIARGQWWDEHGDTMVIAYDGRILNAQHRVHACRMSGITITVRLERFASHDEDEIAAYYATFDVGKQRSLFDIIGYGTCTGPLGRPAIQVCTLLAEVHIREKIRKNIDILYKYIDAFGDVAARFVDSHSSMGTTQAAIRAAFTLRVVSGGWTLDMALDQYDRMRKNEFGKDPTKALHSLRAQVYRRRMNRNNILALTWRATHAGSRTFARVSGKEQDIVMADIRATIDRIMSK